MDRTFFPHISNCPSVTVNFDSEHLTLNKELCFQKEIINLYDHTQVEEGWQSEKLGEEILFPQINRIAYIFSLLQNDLQKRVFHYQSSQIYILNRKEGLSLKQLLSTQFLKIHQLLVYLCPVYPLVIQEPKYCFSFLKLLPLGRFSATYK